MALRYKRAYKDYAIHLIDFKHDKALTVIQMTVPVETHVVVVVEDIYGEKVKALVDGILHRGHDEPGPRLGDRAVAELDDLAGFTFSIVRAAL